MYRYDSKLHFVAPLLALLTTAGCVSGPDYVRPEVPTPDAWETELAGGAEAAEVAIVPWWHTLNDPVLEDLIARAVDNNLDLKIAEARVREARAARGIVAADGLPSLGLSGSYRVAQSPEQQRASGGSPVSVGASVGPNGLTRNLSYRGENATLTRTVSAAGATNGITVTPGGGMDAPDRTQDMFALGFDASWELDLFGRVQRAVEAADASIEAEEARLRNLHVSLAAEVALNYLDYRMAQGRLDIARRNIDAQRESLRLTRARFDAGLSSEFDAVRSEAQLASFESQVPLLETQRETSLHRIGVLLGDTPGSLAETLANSAPMPIAPEHVPVGLPSELLQRRPDIQTAERELAAATARIGVAMAEQFPKFTLTGGVGVQSLGLGTGMLDAANRVWSVGPGVSFPIFQGGRIRANIDVQNIRQEQALLGYEQTILLALEEVENGLVGFAREQERRKSLAEAVDANQRAVRLANARYNNGLEDFLSVLTAQAQVFESEDRLLQSESLVLMQLVALYKALGGGWEPGAMVVEQAE
ncbi:MAG: efflux transporter outer membrane subunit [Candidatus Hydrogenedens sp.]|nr:efflux transporter outer membrane subunit [Candidatus Hydrogenedens sp.]